MTSKMSKTKLYEEIRKTLTADNMYDWCDIATAIVASICVTAGMTKEQFLTSCASHFDVLDKKFSTLKPN